MKLQRAGAVIFSFCVSFGLTFWWKSSGYREVIAPSVVPGVTAAAAVVDSSPVVINSREELKTILSLPLSLRNDARLAELSKTLLATDPEAAFRAAMAEWQFDRTALMEAAEALVKLDPGAARRLMAECPDLRSKAVLEGWVMADEVSRNPREKLRWAEQNLEGEVKRRAVTEGAKALSVEDPAAALEFTEELSPGIVKLDAILQSLPAALKQDPAAAAAWIRANVDKSNLGIVDVVGFMRYLKEMPNEGPTLLEQLPADFQSHMAEAILYNNIIAITDTGKMVSKAMQSIENLPESLRADAVRSLILTKGPEIGDEAQFLAGLSTPEQRATALEAMAWNKINNYSSNPGTETLDALSIFQTTEDKQSAARMVPYMRNLTEGQRTALLEKLQ